MPLHNRSAQNASTRFPLERTLLCSLSLVVLASSAWAQPAVAPASLRASAACTLHSSGRTYLEIAPGDSAYIEPMFVSSSGSQTLLAGVPNYVYPRGARDSNRATPEDSIFGVVRNTDGTSLPVPHPVSSQKTFAVRGIAAPGGGWHIFFSTVPNSHVFPAPETETRLWYGHLRNNRWETVEELQTTQANFIQSLISRPPVMARDTLWWTVLYEAPSGPGVMVYSRAAGKTALEIVPVENALWSAATVHNNEPAILLTRGGESVGSVTVGSLYLRRPSWQLAGELVGARYGPARSLAVNNSSRGTILTWTRGAGGEHVNVMDAFVWVGDPMDQNKRPIFLGTIADPSTVLTLPNGDPFLVTRIQLGPDSEAIRIHSVESTGPVAAEEFPTPFAGPISASQTGPNKYLLAGPVLRRNNSSVPLVTLLLEYTATCNR